MGFDKTKAVRAAEKYLAQGKIPAAIQEYRRIVERDPADVNALNTLGDLFSRIDKKDDAVGCFLRVADHYRQQGFALKAIAVYKKVTRFKQDAPEIAAALAELYEQQGLMVDARAQYLVVADSYARRGQNREALEVLRRVADLDPNNTQIRLRLAESLVREGLHDLAAEAYTEVGERLQSRGEHERALEAYDQALVWRPHSHAALQGLVTAHSVLGTADEAAERIAKAVEDRPGDLELRAMLVRAHVEAENAPAAEVAIQELVFREPQSFAFFFDLARLHLKQDNVNKAVSVLARIIELALSGREEDTMLELLQEALARDPEQIEALGLQARVHAWRRDDDGLRVVLENLAEVAESLGLPEEARAALAQLVRLSPHEAHYRERLIALGGVVEDEQVSTKEQQESSATSSADAAASEVPTFESFMLPEETHTPPAPKVSEATGFEFEWNTVESQPAPKPSAVGESGSETQPRAAVTYGEVDFDKDAAAASGDGQTDAATHEASRVAMLKQELESVDFYLEQGYTDVARDTLDMIERQFGVQDEIETRRMRLRGATTEGARDAAPPPAEPLNVEKYDALETGVASSSPSTGGAPSPQSESVHAGAPPPSAPVEAPNISAPPHAPVEAGLDSGLAAIFDEFREAVEEADAHTEEDFETHYNLGLAYKEMDLLDQAVEAFQTAASLCAPRDGTARYLQCCNMLGHCFIGKGEPRLAAMWFKKGMDAPGHTEDEYQALRYELGNAYEQMGDLQKAIDTFSEVYGINVSYRGVGDKLRDLQAQKATK